MLWLLGIFSIVSLSSAQPLNNPFPWTLDPKTPLDNTILPGQPTKTTAAKGRIAISNGKLVYPDGTRARLYGVTIAGPAVFPDSSQAIAVAARLRSLGINLVRLTHFDYTNYNDASIIIHSSTTSRGFDSTMLRRFDWFIAQLRQQGIYVSLVIRAARLARRDDGVPGWDSIRYSGRIYSYFLPAYQMLVRDFVRDLLSRRNLFTGVPYADDPTIAVIELEQDNSIFTQWVSNTVFPLSQGGQLSYLHSRMLDSAFIRYVLAKYGSAQAAQAAWRFVPRTTANIVGNPSFEDPFDNTWLLTLSGGAVAVVERDPLDKRDGGYSMRIRISQPGTAPGNVRYRNIQPQLERYALYRIQLWARTDVPQRLVTFAIGNFSFRDTLRQQWKEYTYTFRSNIEGPAEFRVDAGGTSGDVWLDNVRITAVEEPGLLSGESLSNYTVARSRYSQYTVHSLPRWRDNLQFYESLAEKWFGWMARLIHDTLRCKALIAPGNQQSLLNDIYVARLLDLPSVGTGWDSPYRRIAGATSDSAWYITNDPQLGNRNGGILYVPARTRIAGKPLMVNSYSVPYPFSAMGELTTLLPAYLAYQDADVFVLTYYAYNRSSLETPWVRDRYGPNAAGTITHYEYAGNPAVTSALPLSTAVFCNQLIRPALDELRLEQTREALDFPPFNQSGAFFLASGADARIPLFRRVAIDSFSASLQSYQPHREIPALADQGAVNTSQLLSDTEELLWNATDTVFLVRTPRYRAAVGVLRGKILDVSGINTHTVERLDNGWVGSCEFLSLDSAALDSAERVAILLLSRTAASGVIWSGDSSTYRGWGTAPMQLEAMTVTVTWRHSADTLRLIPLDSLGLPIVSRAVTLTKGTGGRFRFTLDQRQHHTPWFLARFSRAPMTTSAEMQIHTMPTITVTDDRIVISRFEHYSLPRTATLYAMDGRCVARWDMLNHQQENAELPLPQIAHGAYTLVLDWGRERQGYVLLVRP
ncbi:MAG: hypothetical protein AA908_01810 [Chlorobi bacterium NICIL-2]|jgi:hypothetical protein|nr:MAG: hypothetical protein AA908_01810 [Chlorobi bacterium NICIL-2]